MLSQSSAAEEMLKLWMLQKRMYQLCHARGYKVGVELLHKTFEDFMDELYEDCTSEDEHPEKMDVSFHLEYQNNPEDVVLVFFPNESAVDVHTINWLSEHINRDFFSCLIIVVKESITFDALMAAYELMSHGLAAIVTECSLL